MSQSGQEPNTPPSTRTMADIARLFLDGARQTPEAGAPKRISPQARTRIVAPPPAVPLAPAPSKTLEQPAKKNGHASSSSVLPQVMLALTGKESSPASAQRLLAAANALAHEHHAAVCVLSLQNESFAIDIAGLQSLNDLPPIHCSAGPADMQIARTLFTLRHAARHWIIASPDPAHPLFSRLAAAVSDWLLVTATDNDSVVAAYQQLKRALTIATPDRAPRAILLTNDYADAALIHSRLRRAAREFLNHDLALAAVAPNASADALRLAAIPVGGGGDFAAIWSAVLDELCGAAAEEPAPVPAHAPEPAAPTPLSLDLDDAIAQAAVAFNETSSHAAGAAAASQILFDHLTNVLDPEERAALAADLYEPPLPVATSSRPPQPLPPSIPDYDIRAPIASPIPAKDPSKSESPDSAIRNPQSEMENSPALRVLDFPDHPADRAAQWRSVETSIPDLIPDAVLLDARPPMFWATESCVAVDAAGALHVWTLYKDGVSWFALREWAAEHSAILALTRRDLPIQKESPIAIHIVLPLDLPAAVDPAAPKSDAMTLLRTPAPHVFVYRLRLVQWQGRRGTVVVPIA